LNALVEETVAALVDIDHKWRIYSDGVVMAWGLGAKGVWGASGYEAAIYLVQDDESVKEVNDLCGLVTEASSVWWMGAKRGTNQTGELCGVMQGLLWLLEYAADDLSDVAICVDSLYVGNELEACGGILEEELQRGADNIGAIFVGSAVLAASNQRESTASAASHSASCNAATSVTAGERGMAARTRSHSALRAGPGAASGRVCAVGGGCGGPHP
jgi:hypothetical protein